MCKYSPKANGSCVKFYDPLDNNYKEIACNYCKGHMNAHIAVGQIHDIQFVCDEESIVTPFMRVCYRYRNWYGDNDEFIFISKENEYFEFMKLCMDSNDIHQPVIYEATCMYEGLSQDGNPNWIILGNIRMIKKLRPYKK
ncbi:MAG: hypothetical protein VZR10_08015 [Methanobrevibacter sp.]|nr:hypothetical protein [Methanobrevibacter sp.]